MEPKDPDKQVFIANLMPSRGSWLEVEIDKKGIVYARIDRKRKLPITTLLRALPAEDPTTGAQARHVDERDDPQALRQLVLHPEHAGQGHDDPRGRGGRRGLQEAAPGRAADARERAQPSPRPLLRSEALRPHEGRPLQAEPAARGRRRPTTSASSRRQDIVALVRKLVDLPKNLGVPEDAKDFAADAYALSREPIRGELDEYEDFGNRRLRTVGELIQEAFRVGLYRMERVVRERMTTEDVDTITPQTIINIRPVVAALKEFFGSSQLSQFMDQTNSLSGLTHRRRLSALGAGGLTRERAPIEVRDVHPTHYGRMCPIETPEGPNIGLIGSLSSMATVSEFGFVQTPYRDRQEREGDGRDRLPRRERGGEAHDRAGERAASTRRPASSATTRCSAAAPAASPSRRSRRTSSTWTSTRPRSSRSATALIPFLEHNDANRALMGANMQRQAVPLLITDAPLVGTGLEYRAAVDTGDVILAKRAGTVTDVDAEKIIGRGEGRHRRVRARQVHALEPGHDHPPEADRRPGPEGRGRTRCSPTAARPSQGELALGKNLLVAFMPFEGYNFEDAIVISERIVKDDVLSSVHIHEYEIDARATKLGDEEITRDIPNRSEESLRDLDDRGVVRIGAEVGSGDLLVGKVTPKGETELTAEEKLIRAIFKEKAREVRDTSLKVPHGEGGKVIDVKTFSRDNGDDLSPGVNELVRVYVAKKRKIAEGDKLAGRHGNKGVISKIVPQEDMPFIEDGTPVDVILNPLGVPSRMNIGQILETHLGWAAALRRLRRERRAERPDADRDARVRRRDRGRGRRRARRVDEAEPESPINFKVDEKRRPGRRCSGKVRLFSGAPASPSSRRSPSASCTS